MLEFIKLLIILFGINLALVVFSTIFLVAIPVWKSTKRADWGGLSPEEIKYSRLEEASVILENSPTEFLLGITTATFSRILRLMSLTILLFLLAVGVI